MLSGVDCIYLYYLERGTLYSAIAAVLINKYTV